VSAHRRCEPCEFCLKCECVLDRLEAAEAVIRFYAPWEKQPDAFARTYNRIGVNFNYPAPGRATEYMKKYLPEACISHDWETKTQPGGPWGPPEYFAVCKVCGAEKADD
jgi:hypothetical protein